MNFQRLWHICLIAVSVFFGATASLAAKERRVALVVGNSAYQHTAELKNPKNDAADVAAQFRRLGFDVVEAYDADKRSLERAIRSFAQSLSGADVGVFYYAGHGLQVGGLNYIVPVDAKLDDASGLDFEMVRLDLVHRTMEREAKTNVLFIDACRDNPLARNLARAMGTRSGGIGRGLAAVESGVGTLISFSTQPGNVALDGDGRNSPYAASLASRLAKSTDDLSTILIGVRNDVMSTTRDRQVPWEHSALRARLYFGDPPASAAPVIPAPAIPEARAVPNYDKEMEIAFWNAVKDSKSPAVLQTYVDRFPAGTFANLARVMIENAKQPRAAPLPLPVPAEKLPASAPPVPIGPVAALPVPPSAPVAPPVDPEALTRAIQAELKRVGCDPGSVDGKWGGKVKSALGQFSRLRKVSLPTDDPTPAALQAIANQKGRVCSLECDDDEVEADGKCVPKRPEAKARSETKSRSSSSNSPGSPGSSARQRPAASASPPVSTSGKICWDSFSRNTIVPCDHPRAVGK
jgi:Caspase domain